MDLPLIFGIIIAFGISVYIILDGFDLGVGILFLWDRDELERDQMMNSIAPFWDGNETWLILGGGAFYGVFPKAAAILFPALYVPIMLMLFALIFRGVAFEFRFKADTTKSVWNWAFCLGSLLAAFAQGTMLGNFIQGFHVLNGEFAGSTMDWLTPFSVFTGCALVLGYALLGATWLMMKTSGSVQEKAFNMGKPLMISVCVGIGIVSLWTPLMDSHIASRWFNVPGFFILAPIPMLSLILTYMLWVSIDRRSDRRPFFLAIGLFMLAYLGLGMSMWPYVVPRHLTFWDVASPYETQIFILVGVGLLIPFILGYTAYVFYVFRGKVNEHVEYH
jgi:cytochrome d ubiquinol oxidase subunit II